MPQHSYTNHTQPFLDLIDTRMSLPRSTPLFVSGDMVNIIDGPGSSSFLIIFQCILRWHTDHNDIEPLLTGPHPKPSPSPRTVHELMSHHGDMRTALVLATVSGSKSPIYEEHNHP